MINAEKEILIVDDEPAYRVLVYKTLKSLGCRVSLAQNGEEAVVALWEKPNIALVLLDVRLPYMNGLSIFDIIRKDFRDKKVIICSSLQREEQRFLLNDVDDYYCKSEDLTVLTQKVENILNNRCRMAEQRENEKRNSRRIPVNIFANCEKVNPQVGVPYIRFLSYTKDLSLKGGRFVVAEDIQEGQYFSASLELPDTFLPLLIDCEVIWVKKLEDHGPNGRANHEVGVRFVKLDLQQDEEKLKNYLSFV
ncbi:MAG: response regulator [Candidatus Omnitrophica bacterium]|nr:response regulator [Candidatus Omnitrophota bacterium]